MKALLLAAGFGTRLRPFTEVRPKPLCPFFGIPFVDFAIRKIENSQLSLAVNTHYHPEQVTTHLDNVYSQAYFHSHEPEIRGTGGAISPLRSWLEDDDLLIYNGDIVSTIDLEAMGAFHRLGNHLATMALLKTPAAGKSPLLIDSDQVVDIGRAPKKTEEWSTFTGIHILSREFVDRIPETVPWSIIDTYREFLKEGRSIGAFIHDGFWADLGTPEDLWQAHMDVIKCDWDGLNDELGIDELREKHKLAPLLIDQQNNSCIAQGVEYSLAPSQSFVDIHSEVIMHSQINQSIVISRNVGLLKEDIQRKIVLEDLSADF